MTTHTPTEPVDVLLVEDNPGDVRLTREAFKSIDSEVEFHTVTDGKEATKYFDVCETETERPDPDLILLDLNLPRIDGFRVLEILQNELDVPPPPILVLSSSEAKADIVESYERAANAYLTKPESPAEFDTLAQAIEDFWLESAHHPPAPS
ncbi:response regulator [Natronolimnohabitans sp. A-GB9]|uniref:response regulator n=1 Tax=Natronolimnohabitans sp. A-GB9 TaxID=3069757 RepID=UPI0027B31B8D|nr:response regulator [Natronolimnohabitans sp. A-GB9]MDQ2049967.1 response regulator [Natronolimnohabitans sp. A-GB9]